MLTDTTQVICVQLAEHVVELIQVGQNALLELLDMLFRSPPNNGDFGMGNPADTFPATFNCLFISNMCPIFRYASIQAQCKPVCWIRCGCWIVSSGSGGQSAMSPTADAVVVKVVQVTRSCKNYFCIGNLNGNIYKL